MGPSIHSTCSLGPGTSSALLPSVLYETQIPSFLLAAPNWPQGGVGAPSAGVGAGLPQPPGPDSRHLCSPIPSHRGSTSVYGMLSTAAAILTRYPSAGPSAHP